MSEREILFRGKRVDNGEWVEGYFFRQYGSNEIITADNEIYHITPDTVGQYTGLTDKNGTKIYEGDIVHWKKVPYFVRWDSKKAEFVFANDIKADYFVVGFNEHTTMKFCKVVGNIHDNPTLLEDE